MPHISSILAIVLAFIPSLLFAQVGIGTTTPDPHAILDLHIGATPQGLLLPRLSLGQRTTLGGTLTTAQVGLLVADTSSTQGGVYVWDGSAWVSLTAAGGVITGSGAVGHVARWDGTTNLTDGSIQDNGSTVGIGNAPAPNTKLTVSTGPTQNRAISAEATNTNVSNFGTYSLAQNATTHNYGLYGMAQGTTGNLYGVYGNASGNSSNKYGVYGTASGTGTNWAGYFDGNTYAGSLQLQNATPGVGTALLTRNGTGLVQRLDYTNASQVLRGDGSFGAVPGLTPGTLTHQTLRWDGTTWNNNSALQASATTTGIGGAPNATIMLQAQALVNGQSIAMNGITSSINNTNYGLYGIAENATNINYGVYGRAAGTSGDRFGTYGFATGNGNSKYGVFGVSNGTGTNFGVYGTATGGTSNYAGYFNSGIVHVGDSLGIGTTVPFNKFSITGTSSGYAGNVQDGLFMDIDNRTGTSNSMAGIRLKVNNLSTNQRYHYGIFANTIGGVQRLTFAVRDNAVVDNVTYDNGIMHLIATGGGRVGIKTASPLYDLDVVGATRFSGNSIIGGTLDMQTSRILNVATPTAATDAVNKAYVDGGFIQNQSAVSQVGNYRINGNASAGSMAIGVATPEYLVDIVGGTSATESILLLLRSNFTTAGTATVLRMSNTTNTTGNVGFVDLVANRSNQLNIRSTGNVGIDEAAPLNKLHVNGGITAAGMSLISHTDGVCKATGNTTAYTDLFEGRVYVPPGTATLEMQVFALPIIANGNVRFLVGGSPSTVASMPSGAATYYSVTLSSPPTGWQTFIVQGRLTTAPIGSTMNVCAFNLVTQ